MAFLTDHLEEVGESYREHMVRAMGFAMAMLLGGVACLVHALLPFLFVKTGSDRIRHLHDAMVENRADSHSEPVVDEDRQGVHAAP